MARATAPAFRRLSGYRVRPSVAGFPEAVLLGAAVWELTAGATGRATTSGEGVVLGLALGAAWAVVRRTSVNVGEIVKSLVGIAALTSSLAVLTFGSECSPGLSPVQLALVSAVLAGSLLTAVLLGFWKVATLRRPSAGSYLMALVALVELGRFAIAPAGESLLDNLSGAAAGALVLGVVLVALLSAINPRGAEAMVGAGVAIGGVYLPAVGTQLETTQGPSCHSFTQQLILVAAFTVVPNFAPRR